MMIALIVPTYNRAYALEQVLSTFYTQEAVTEIIFIDDGSCDHTKDVIDRFASRYPKIQTIYLKNAIRSGASFSRKRGVEAARSEFVLFCDDDEFLEPNYTQVCLEKIKNGKADIVSGRHFYRLPSETIPNAIKRFGKGLEKTIVFDPLRFRLNLDACFEGDIELPFTHGIYLCKRSLLIELGIDPYYAKGNGFREESDVQVKALSQGRRILMTNDTHCIHMHKSEVKSGGQRTGRIKRFYWTIHYTNYFLRKYFFTLKGKLNLPYSRLLAMMIFSTLEFYIFFIRPFFLLPHLGLKKLRA